jgi:DnaJ-domain-containing protein 1
LTSLQQDVALQLSSYVNESFKTLSRPVLRAEYILSRNDIHPSETEHLDDPAFIMEIMDAREELEQASSREEVEPIAADVQGMAPHFV